MILLRASQKILLFFITLIFVGLVWSTVEILFFKARAVHGLGIIKSYEYSHETCRGPRSSIHNCTKYVAFIELQETPGIIIKLPAGEVRGIQRSTSFARWPINSSVALLYKPGNFDDVRINTTRDLWEIPINLFLILFIFGFIASALTDWFILKFELYRSKNFLKRRAKKVKNKKKS
jgi:hypothetical protein